jgi:hypothetical protein
MATKVSVRLVGRSNLTGRFQSEALDRIRADNRAKALELARDAEALKRTLRESIESITDVKLRASAAK